MEIQDTGAYIISGLRTPIGKYGGTLSSIRADDMMAYVIKKLIEKQPNLPVNDIDEVIIGCSNQAGEDNRNIARMALLLAGLPLQISGITLNRLCSSGLDAVIHAYNAIKSGSSNILIVGGVENMSRAPYVLPKSFTPFQRGAEIYDSTLGWRFINKDLEKIYGAESLGITAENVAVKYHICRKSQDKFAYRSHSLAKKAIANNRLSKEIQPIEAPYSKNEILCFSEDERPRNTSTEELSKLKSIFKKDGTVTAGNSSGINDGAAVLLVASGSKVKECDWLPLAEIKESTMAGVHPSLMGIGPISSTENLFKKTGYNFHDFDLIEINEAFASQVLACLKSWGLSQDDNRINPNGGAIALGHPLGMSGARLVLTSAHELKVTGVKRALVTMCVGVGQGVSLILESIKT